MRHGLFYLFAGSLCKAKARNETLQFTKETGKSVPNHKIKSNQYKSDMVICSFKHVFSKQTIIYIYITFIFIIVPSKYNATKNTTSTLKNNKTKAIHTPTHPQKKRKKTKKTKNTKHKKQQNNTKVEFVKKNKKHQIHK